MLTIGRGFIKVLFFESTEALVGLIEVLFFESTEALVGFNKGFGFLKPKRF